MSIVDIHTPAGDGYGVIYADPPWSYHQQGNGAAARHYPTMTPDEIKALPVQALDTICAWGFEYKTLAFCWIKKNKRSGGGWGLGSYTRQNAEVCLLAVKGHPRVVSHSVHSVIQSPIRQHSQKPPEARDRIVQLFGDQRRLELFARESTPGWDAWGNEVQDHDTALL